MNADEPRRLQLHQARLDSQQVSRGPPEAALLVGWFYALPPSSDSPVRGDRLHDLHCTGGPGGGLSFRLQLQYALSAAVCQYGKNTYAYAVSQPAGAAASGPAAAGRKSGRCYIVQKDGARLAYGGAGRFEKALRMVRMKVGRRELGGARYATGAAVAAAAIYAAISAYEAANARPHFEWLIMALRYAALLPALLFALRPRPECEPLSMPALRARWVAAAFLIVAAAANWRMAATPCADESAYQFQARIFAQGRLAAPSPIPYQEGAPRVETLHFTNTVLAAKGWFAKYPIGWPAALALPNALGLGWLVNPLLGCAILLIAARLAREEFGPAAELPAAAMFALSPFTMAVSTGTMSHGLCGALVAGATLLCLQGIRTLRLSRFAWMFALLTAAFTVRPYTAALCALVLGCGALAAVWNERKLRLQLIAASAAAALAAAVAVGGPNWLYSANPLVSPYSLYSHGTTQELDFSIAGIADKLVHRLRFSVQSTAVYAFPFLALLAAAAFWKRAGRAWGRAILLALPLALAAGYVPQVLGSAPVIGDRYWSEGYFALVALAAGGLVRLCAAWPPPRRAAIAVAVAMAATQVAMLGAAVWLSDAGNAPRRAMVEAERTFAACDCVVFVQDSPPHFYAGHINLNRPDWQAARVFYAVDPGAQQRAHWTQTLRKFRWVVLRYDATAGKARMAGAGAL